MKICRLLPQIFSPMATAVALPRSQGIRQILDEDMVHDLRMVCGCWWFDLKTMFINVYYVLRSPQMICPRGLETTNPSWLWLPWLQYVVRKNKKESIWQISSCCKHPQCQGTNAIEHNMLKLATGEPTMTNYNYYNSQFVVYCCVCVRLYLGIWHILPDNYSSQNVGYWGWFRIVQVGNVTKTIKNLSMIVGVCESLWKTCGKHVSHQIPKRRWVNPIAWGCSHGFFVDMSP
jgi:hypothetical protein